MSDLKTIEKISGFAPGTDSTPIYYETRGTGEPVVFVYGIACLMNHWHLQIEHFSRTMRSIAFDLRGHHKSTPILNPDHLTLSDLALDMISLLEHLNIKQAHFAGHSFGAPVILEAYRMRPDLFKSITFVNGFAKNPIKGMFGLDVIEPLFYFIKASYFQNPTLWNSLWRMAVDNPLSLRLAALAGGFNLRLTHFKDIEVYARGVAHMDLPVFIRLFEEMMRFDGDKILGTIQCPTLIIAGENDRVTPRSFQHALHEKIPHSEFMLVPYGSHCTQLDFPDYVNIRLEKFWGV